MRITEKEIFKYVFFRDTLSNECILEIEQNGHFESELEYYFGLKVQLENNISYNTKIRLAEKIPVYSLNDIIVLKPLALKEEVKSISLLRYAAASKSDKEMPVVTFANESQDYFVRVHKTDNKFRVFIFSTLQEKLENVRLTFFPSQENITIKDIENPFQVSLSKFPDRIEMKLN